MAVSVNHDLQCVFVHTPKCGGLFVQQVLDTFYGFQTAYFTHERHSDFARREDHDAAYGVFEVHGQHAVPVRSTNQYGCTKVCRQGILAYCMSSEVHARLADMTPEKWRTYTRFAVKRSPYDRFVSAAEYVNKIRRQKREVAATSFAALASLSARDERDLSGEGEELSDWEWSHLYVPQHQHLRDPDGALRIDHWLRFEHLNEDLCRVLLALGVPQLRHRELLLENMRINATDHEPFPRYYSPETLAFANAAFAEDFAHLGYAVAPDMDALRAQAAEFCVSPDAFARRNVRLAMALDQEGKLAPFSDAYYATAASSALMCPEGKARLHREEREEERGKTRATSVGLETNKHGVKEGGGEEGKEGEEGEEEGEEGEEGDMVLPNGVRLNLRQARAEERTPPDHYQALLALLGKMATNKSRAR